MALTEAAGGLFDPVNFAGLRLRNRFAMAPMTRGFAPGGILSRDAIDYYRRRAEGGVGLILTEGCAINEIGAWTANIPSLFGDDALSVWREIVAAVHAAGGTIMAQLWHAGLGRVRPAGHLPERPSVGAWSDYPQSPATRSDDSSYQSGEALSKADIDATIADYARAAAAAHRLGFDGIELHGAHGYLIDQFFWDQSNRRTDEYNGDIGARARFAVEVIRAIRGEADADFPVGLRFSQWKLPDRYEDRAWPDPKSLGAFLEPLVDAGVSFFHCSTRRFWQPAFDDEGPTLSGWTRRLSGKPVITVGSIGLDSAFETSAEHIGDTARPASLDRLERLLAAGEFDLAAVGRALIANPDWVNLMRDGRLSALQPYDAAALGRLH